MTSILSFAGAPETPARRFLMLNFILGAACVLVVEAIIAVWLMVRRPKGDLQERIAEGFDDSTK